MKSQKKCFNGLRCLAIVALICTVIVTVLVLAESGLPGGITGAITQAIKEEVKDTLQIVEYDKNLAPKSMKFTANTVYYGKKTKLNVTYAPSNANPAYTYEFQDLHGNPVDGLTIDEDGYILSERLDFVYNGLFLKITSKLDEKITYTAGIDQETIDPFDSRIEKIEPIWSEQWMGTTDTLDEYIKVGKPYYLYFQATIKDAYLEEFGRTFENNKVVFGVYGRKLKINGENVNLSTGYLSENFFFGNSVCFYKEHSFVLSGSLASSTNERYNFEFTVEGIIDPDFQYIPSELVLNTNSYQDASLTYENGEYVLTFNKQSSSFNVGAINQSDPYRNTQTTIKPFDDHAKNCVRISGTKVYRKVNRGECYLLVVSDVAPEDENLQIKVRCVFNGDAPEKIAISTKDSISINSDVELTCAINNGANLFGEEGVKWSIVKGHGKAEFTSPTTIHTKHVGKITLRVESVVNPEVYDEVTFDIKIYDDLYSFVRKILGHALLYACLGLGYGTLYFFLIKHRWVTAVATPVTVFALGGFGELLQSLNPGRYPSWIDVATDFVGGIIGFAFGAFIAVATCLIWWKANKKSFDNLVAGFKRLTLFTLFKKTEKVFVDTTNDSTDVPCDQMQENDVEEGDLEDKMPVCDENEVAADDETLTKDQENCKE